MGGLFVLIMLPLMLFVLLVAFLALIAWGMLKIAFVLALLCALGLVVLYVVLRRKGFLARLNASDKKWQRFCGAAIPIIIAVGVVGCLIFAAGDAILSGMLDQWLHSNLTPE